MKPLEIELSSGDVASLVNGDDSLKAAVIALYLKQNAPSLKVSDLAKAQSQEKVAESVENTLHLSADTLTVAAGASATLDMTAKGYGELLIQTANDRIAVAKADGDHLIVSGIAAGQVPVTLTKGDMKVVLQVTVS